MALTKLQQERIRFHLGYSTGGFISSISEVNDFLVFELITPEQETMIIGSLDNDADNVLIGEEAIANAQSGLGRVERAYNNLDPDVVDASLYVESAGKVVLRGNELKKRAELYDWLKQQLAAMLGINISDRYSFGSGRVGYTAN